MAGAFLSRNGKGDDEEDADIQVTEKSNVIPMTPKNAVIEEQRRQREQQRQAAEARSQPVVVQVANGGGQRGGSNAGNKQISVEDVRMGNGNVGAFD